MSFERMQRGDFESGVAANFCQLCDRNVTHDFLQNVIGPSIQQKNLKDPVHSCITQQNGYPPKSPRLYCLMCF